MGDTASPSSIIQASDHNIVSGISDQNGDGLVNVIISDQKNASTNNRYLKIAGISVMNMPGPKVILFYFYRPFI